MLFYDLQWLVRKSLNNLISLVLIIINKNITVIFSIIAVGHEVVDEVVEIVNADSILVRRQLTTMELRSQTEYTRCRPR